MNVLSQFSFVQIWTGLMLSTVSGIGVLIHPIVNFSRKGRFELVEKIVKIYILFPKILTNIIPKCTDKENKISQPYPIMHIIVLLRIAYLENILVNAVKTVELYVLNTLDWEKHNSIIVKPNKDRTMYGGAYAAAVQRWENCCPLSQPDESELISLYHAPLGRYHLMGWA